LDRGQLGLVVSDLIIAAVCWHHVLSGTWVNSYEPEFMIKWCSNKTVEIYDQSYLYFTVITVAVGSRTCV